MTYNKKPKMILFDVGGTLFDDGRCIPINGLSALRNAAENPGVTDDETLAELWDGYMEETLGGKPKAKSGINLDFLLSAPIKFVTMRTGLRFNIPMAEQEEIFDRYNSTRTVIDGVPDLLGTLDKLGIRAAVISNNAMSGDSLHLAIKRWIPSEKMEFCLTSADLLLPKPDKTLFECAAAYAHVDPADCWYCGDGRVPDVNGARNGGMTPVLLDTKSEIPAEMRTDGGKGEYLAINHWNVLADLLTKIHGDVKKAQTA
ncbi:MAG: HAD family hydrolase [Clostridia bacterium]|nr:HAD family hydrolase [Clostridia bacterium]